MVKRLTKIKLARLVAGLTQTEVAEMLGVSKCAVSQWEVGKTSPNVNLIKPLADILHLSVEEVLDSVKKVG